MTIATIERALELARSGRCRSVRDIADQLKRESHASPEQHLAGVSIRRQLIEAMKASAGQG